MHGIAFALPLALTLLASSIEAALVSDDASHDIQKRQSMFGFGGGYNPFFNLFASPYTRKQRLFDTFPHRGRRDTETQLRARRQAWGMPSFGMPFFNLFSSPYTRKNRFLFDSFPHRG